MGACNNSSVAQLVESRTQKPKCRGSNHGVDDRLVDLGHPNKMFRFPSPSTSKGWVGRSDKKKLKNNFKVIQFL